MYIKNANKWCNYKQDAKRKIQNNTLTYFLLSVINETLKCYKKCNINVKVKLNLLGIFIFSFYYTQKNCMCKIC